MRLKKVKAFYLANSSLTVERTDETIREGETVSIKDTEPVKLCQSGLHACRKPSQCLNYRSHSDAIMTMVEISGDIDEGDDKLCGRSRKTIKVFDKDYTQAAWAEYEKALSAAKAERDKAIAPAKAEYDKAIAPAKAERDKANSAAWAEYDKARSAARAEHDKACSAATKEYDSKFRIRPKTKKKVVKKKVSKKKK